jgi:pimeloyl-ACP methyl ester carboxylesterase
MAEEMVAVRTGVELCYEELGPANGAPMLLVMGLGTQLIAWPDGLCRDLAHRGYRVVRFDNRDVGRSTHLGDPTPDPLKVALGWAQPAYRLEDLAEDAVALMERLGIDDAHVVGASMGGFVAQLVAICHPDRVRSLSLLMTSTGSRRVGLPRPRLARVVGRRRDQQADRAAAVAVVLAVARAVGSSGYRFDEAYLRSLAERAYDRGYDPDGAVRQLGAILAQRDRTPKLSSIEVPTVVIHGLADPLVGVSGGRALAKAIPGARFVGLAGMGHDLPRELWGRIADEIVATAGAADRRGQLSGEAPVPPRASTSPRSRLRGSSSE